jgi:hypothetical protein
MVVKINGKVLITKTADDDFWVPMARIGDYPSLHCAWELLTQLGLKDFVGQLSFLGTQVLQLLTGVHVVIKCYGLTASALRCPTANSKRTQWIYPDSFFRIAAGAGGPHTLSTVMHLGKYSANYLAIGLTSTKNTGHKRKSLQKLARAATHFGPKKNLYLQGQTPDITNSSDTHVHCTR